MSWSPRMEFLVTIIFIFLWVFQHAHAILQIIYVYTFFTIYSSVSTCERVRGAVDVHRVRNSPEQINVRHSSPPFNFGETLKKWLYIYS